MRINKLIRYLKLLFKAMLALNNIFENIVISIILILASWGRKSTLFLISKVPGTTHGSKQRNLFSYLAVAWVLMLGLDLILRSNVVSGEGAIPGFAYLATLLSLLYFLSVVLIVIFLSSKHWRINSFRLARDICISSLLNILAFSHLYRELGFSLTESCIKEMGELNAAYFSTVTFTTLGYGDFRPCENSRLLAALQALVGNLHLGLFAGVAMLLASEISQGDREVEDSTEQTKEPLKKRL